ncbi:hypothetical protein FRB96_004776 [Tulasnella sp. 330]|nr:hypothetical protein FRB96_004776 [Tulasnella sp. 330]KAG8888803.1 hypothetical protein FRB98_006815 [Tulasnella sp. 332]
MSPTVLLFRTPTPAAEGPDRFISALEAHSYHAFSVPVLEHAFVNVEALVAVIRNSPEERYAGVIVTSGRASEGWRDAAEALLSHAPAISTSWQRTPFYVVGARTADHLVPPSKSTIHFYPASENILGAAESGNAEKLGQFIIQDAQRRESTNLPLLYLTGDKSRDTIRTILDKASIPTQLLQVYETRTSSTLAEDIRKAADATPKQDRASEPRSVTQPSRTWLVFFAPSSAKPALLILDRLYELPILESNPELSQELPEARIAAIGPTTASYLSGEHRPTCLRVDVTSPSPTPEALATAIRGFDAS